MLEDQPLQVHGEFIEDLKTILKGRVLNAQTIELLSDRDDKLVEIVRDINDTRFVRRSYSQSAFGVFERRSIPFLEALAEMLHIFEGAGIEVVPYMLLQPSPVESRFPVVIATEYLENDMATASTDAKVQLAAALGAIPSVPSEFHPGIEIFSSDMFRVRRDENGESLVLVDIDPYLDDKFFTSVSESALDIRNYGYVTKIASNLWDFWCQPAERRAVIGALVHSLVSRSGLDMMVNSRTSQALMTAHSMAQGLDLRS